MNAAERDLEKRVEVLEKQVGLIAKAGAETSKLLLALAKRQVGK